MGENGRMGTTAARAALLALVACSATLSAADAEYRVAIAKWRAEREARLTGETGWLTVAGLSWLKEGENRLGAEPGSEVALPDESAPARAGVVELKDRRVRVRLAPGVQASLGGKPVRGTVELRADTSGTPDVLQLGRLSLLVIERGGRLAIRLRDRESAARKSFRGLSWYDVDERWRVEARFVPYDPPKEIKVPNVLGRSEPMPSPGRAEFVIDGRPVSLDGVLESPDAPEIFFIFRDRTSGVETYGAGRFLYAPRPVAGRLMLDFNKAYNPPCAFTAFATCPLPPPQNALPVPVRAGEKAYAAGH
jgi:uncharacterized protein (DUF1684 family)